MFPDLNGKKTKSSLNGENQLEFLQIKTIITSTKHFN